MLLKVEASAYFVTALQKFSHWHSLPEALLKYILKQLTNFVFCRKGPLSKNLWSKIFVTEMTWLKNASTKNNASNVGYFENKMLKAVVIKITAMKCQMYSESSQ